MCKNNWFKTEGAHKELVPEGRAHDPHPKRRGIAVTWKGFCFPIRAVKMSLEFL